MLSGAGVWFWVKSQGAQGGHGLCVLVGTEWRVVSPPTKEPIWKLPFPMRSVAIGQRCHDFVGGGKGHGSVIAVNHKDKIKME